MQLTKWTLIGILFYFLLSYVLLTVEYTSATNFMETCKQAKGVPVQTRTSVFMIARECYVLK